MSSRKEGLHIDSVNEKAYAKLNISLDVLAKRPDGYHDMRMVMQSVSLCDDLHVALRDDGDIRVSTNLRFLPNDERNIAAKAARAFFAKLGGKDRGVEITIVKRIPVRAGMGGGSSDGAAVLRALNRLTGKPFSRAELEDIGAQLGSDIPFCVAGGTALAEGRGEKLTALPPFPDCRFVIVKPSFSVSTPELFAKLDLISVKYHPDTQGILAALYDGALSELCHRMYNVFEDVLPPRQGELAQIKSGLLDCGALGAVMTGTGSAVFGVFDEPQRAKTAKRLFAQRFREVFVAEPQAVLEL